MGVEKELSLVVCVCGVLGLAAASGCGDDGGDGNGAVDAMQAIDASMEPDANEGVPLERSGTLAITELVLAGTANGVFGAVNVLSFADETSRTVPPLEGFESPVGGCLVTIYDVGTDEEPDTVDAGDISVTGTGNGDYDCKFQPTRGEYVCQSTTTGVAGGSATGAVIDAADNTLTLTGASWPSTMVGMWMVLDDFPIINAMGPLELPIVGVNGDELTFGADLTVGDTGDGNSTYATFVGVAPVPGGANVLDDGTGDIAINKPAKNGVPAIDLTGKAIGQGFTLLDDAGNDYYLPNDIPVDGSVVKFGCNADSDGCGVLDKSGDDFTVSALTINGITTDGTLPAPADDPLGTAMPDPDGQYAVFQCAKLSVQGSGIQEVSIPAAAMSAIMGTDPSRIRISVTHSSGSIESASDGSTRVNAVVGHGVLGYTDP